MKTANSDSVRTEKSREMTFDQISTLRLAIAWLMAKNCPTDAQQWLTAQRNEIDGNENLKEMASELELLLQDLTEIIQLGNPNLIPKA
jgi:hypothetical protein